MSNSIEYVPRGRFIRARYIGLSEEYQGHRLEYGETYWVSLLDKPERCNKLLTWVATGIKPSELIFVKIMSHQGWTIECPYTEQGLRRVWKLIEHEEPF